MLFYSVDLEDGETYQVDIKGKDTCCGYTMDHTMLGHIQAPDGSFVEDDNNLFAVGGGERRNTRYVFTTDQDGHVLPEGGRPDNDGQQWQQPLPVPGPSGCLSKRRLKGRKPRPCKRAAGSAARTDKEGEAGAPGAPASCICHPDGESESKTANAAEPEEKEHTI